MTRPGWPSVVVESCTPATVRLLTYGRTSRIYPSVKFARNHPMLTRCRASVTRQRNSFVTSRSSSLMVDGTIFLSRPFPSTIPRGRIIGECGRAMIVTIMLYFDRFLYVSSRCFRLMGILSRAKFTVPF